LKDKSVQQLRKAAEEKRREMNDKIKQSVSKERDAYLKNLSQKEKRAMVDTLRMEKNIRQEIGEAIKSIN
jgi:CHASE3 domain sensor protein